MQRYQRYDTTSSLPSSAWVEKVSAKEEEETVTGVFNEEEEEVTPADSESEAKVPPVESKNGKRTEGSHGGRGGDAGGGGSKHSMFTWFVVLALLGVWTSMAVVYFDIVDYDSVIARAKEFHTNFSEVLQGKLKAYDSDGDGDFDMEDAKVLLEKKTLADAGQQIKEPPVRGKCLRAALRAELRTIHEKMEAKRIARIALAEIRALLAEEAEQREAAWAAKRKMLEEEERLREERKRMREKEERPRIAQEKERERAAKERAEQEYSQKERVTREERERQNAEEERGGREWEVMERQRLSRERALRDKTEAEKLRNIAKLNTTRREIQTRNPAASHLRSATAEEKKVLAVRRKRKSDAQS
uniref:caldesmon-like n=1 Tax=Solea senegalensis TaxID=28829 RepID=UPI001CD863B0|nr:caldesmon-like [Solea senegalensis]